MHVIINDNTFCSPRMTMKLIFLDNNLLSLWEYSCICPRQYFFLSPQDHEAYCPRKHIFFPYETVCNWLWQYFCYPRETMKQIFIENTSSLCETIKLIILALIFLSPWDNETNCTRQYIISSFKYSVLDKIIGLLERS